MSIFVDKNTKIVVQGITGRDGSFHAKAMKEYGSKVVAGVTPGKGGQDLDGIPIFNTVKDAVEQTGANTAVIYVPVAFSIDAIYEAVDSGVKLVVCITEGVPANDMLKVRNYIDNHTDCRLIGPNCPGIIAPEVTKVGIMPGHIHKKGRVGVVSRSGTLTYEVVYNLTLKGLGQSTCIGIGGDQIIGTKFIDCLKAFEDDPQTEAIVMIGEIGGSDEEEAAEYIKKHVTKPVVAFIAGRTAPPGKRMGHAGAIISGGTGTAADKVKALNAAGIPVAETPSQVADVMAEELKKYRAKKSKKTAAKKPTKKTTKKVAKKSPKKTTKKKATRKTAKKAARKKTARKTTKKATKRATKKTTKKVTKKKATKKKASGKLTKKATKKTARKTPRKKTVKKSKRTTVRRKK